MTTYVPPVDDMVRMLELTGYGEIASWERFAHAQPDDVAELLRELGRFATTELLPLDGVGDREGSRLVDGRVTTPTGFREAYARYVAAGWGGVAFEPEFGGGGLPWAVAAAMQEILAAVNVAFSLCPMLTQGAVELLGTWGTEAQKAEHLAKLVSGEWTGTMNLTEPDAGSDVGAVRTSAVPRDDGSWSVSGTKIFITWGDHDLADRIIHLVLARTPGAPVGTKGISLFLVPDRIGDERNGVRCLSLEHKLGIHASPTAVLQFDGAQGELVGELHGGMAAMFTMMNQARLSVGIEGLGLGERAYQTALRYAVERRQGRRSGAAGSVAIVEHPDVRRMLLTMRAEVDATRALIYTTAHAIDGARWHPSPEVRADCAAMASLLVPLAKAWPTDVVNAVTSTAVQVHGGAGYIEETGVAQLLRDARIAAIYEGTNGIQAIDLVLRKVSMGDTDPLPNLLAGMATAADALRATPGCEPAGDALAHARAQVEDTARWIVEHRGTHPDDVLAVATPFLDALARTVAGLVLSRELVGPLAASSTPRRRTAARFFLTQRLLATPDLRRLTAEGVAPFDEFLDQIVQPVGSS
ncbi:MAG: hypothetical protein JWO68_2968 [Actinomycetia bacterium]|nr:hypothetical protein [Actinomycetes bacterium]